MGTTTKRFADSFPAFFVLLVLMLSLGLAPEANSEQSSAPAPAASQTTEISNPNSININTADAKTIAKALKGIGLKRAQAIVDYREAFGPFSNAEDLIKVKGIGKKTLARNISLIQVQSQITSQ